MRLFEFKGPIECSKSLINRSLVVQSFFPQLDVVGQSKCEDVRVMKKAIVSLLRRQTVDCGAAGTVMRFLCFRASRDVGNFLLTGTERLLSRPQSEIVYILQQLGVKVKQEKAGLVIESEGWKKPITPVLVRREDSSQFASGLLLSAWNLDFPLEFKFAGSSVSDAYWEMTLRLVGSMGMKVEKAANGWIVPPGQKLSVSKVICEPDYSSMATIAMMGTLFGEALFTNWAQTSLQPDHAFPQIIEQAGGHVERRPEGLFVKRNDKLRPLKMSMALNPDLFPTMAVMCSYALGDSTLGSAPQLIHKESNRIEKTAELLKKAGIKTWPVDGGLGIEGRGRDWSPKNFEFDPDEDHRMAMAAGIYKFHNPSAQIINPNVVEKSFPDFWRILGINP